MAHVKVSMLKWASQVFGCSQSMGNCRSWGSCYRIIPWRLEFLVFYRQSLTGVCPAEFWVLAINSLEILKWIDCRDIFQSQWRTWISGYWRARNMSWYLDGEVLLRLQFAQQGLHDGLSRAESICHSTQLNLRSCQIWDVCQALRHQLLLQNICKYLLGIQK